MPLSARPEVCFPRIALRHALPFWDVRRLRVRYRTRRRYLPAESRECAPCSRYLARAVTTGYAACRPVLPLLTYVFLITRPPVSASRLCRHACPGKQDTVTHPTRTKCGCVAYVPLLRANHLQARYVVAKERWTVTHVNNARVDTGQLSQHHRTRVPPTARHPFGRGLIAHCRPTRARPGGFDVHTDTASRTRDIATCRRTRCLLKSAA